MALPADSIKKCPTGGCCSSSSSAVVGLLQFDADLSEMDAVDCHVVRSESVIVEGFPWHLSVMIEPEIDSTTLLLFLVHDIEIDSNFWSMDVRCIFRIVNRTTPADTISHELSMKFDADETMSAPVHVYRKMLDKRSGFLVNDCIRVEAEFTVVDMKGFRKSPSIDFTDAANPCFDVCLVVEGSKLYANKAILAAHSSVFHSMFFGDLAEREKKEIELKDVNKDEFLVLLRLVYAGMVAGRLVTNELRDKNVESVLKLADRFGVTSVVEKCETHLMSDECEMETIELYSLADEFRLPFLQDDVLQSLETVKEIRELERFDVFSELSAEGHAALFRRMLKLAEEASLRSRKSSKSSASSAKSSHSEKSTTRNGQNNKATNEKK